MVSKPAFNPLFPTNEVVIKETGKIIKNILTNDLPFLFLINENKKTRIYIIINWIIIKSVYRYIITIKR